jgi:hypothetical protein
MSVVLLTIVSCSSANSNQSVSRLSNVPMAWDHRDEAARWTRAGLQAIDKHGQSLVQTVPGDIGKWCPTYAKNGPDKRAAFWVGLMSALARHESTWRPDAVGGGGQWFGLTQISPATARGYGCMASSGSELLNGSANISCAVRIAAHQVARDDAVVTDGEGWRGMARDWAPFRNEAKREAMAAFTSRQPYCR